MDQQLIFLTLLGMALVTYLPRMFPVTFLSSRDLPPLLVKWLSFVPTAVLSAMLFPELFLKNGSLDLHLSNIYLMAAIPTFLVGWKTRSLFITVLCGMIIVAGYRLIWA